MKGRSKHINKTLTGTDHSVVRPEGGREAGEAEGVKGVEGDGGRRGLGWWAHRWGRNQEASGVRNRIKRVFLGGSTAFPLGKRDTAR